MGLLERLPFNKWFGAGALGSDDTIVLVGNDSSDIIGRGNGAIKDANYLVHNW